MNAPVSHDWVIARAQPHLAGLLDDGEVTRLEQHLAECASCRALLDDESRAAALPEPASPHIPAEILGTWNNSIRTLRGLERAMVRRHLERCAECRRDLQVLGHAAELERVPELEAEEAPAGTREAVDVDPARWRPGVRAGSPASHGAVERRRPHWATWALAGWATAATAAAIVLLLNLRRHEAPSATTPASEPTARIAPMTGAMVTILSDATELRGPARGEAAKPVTVRPDSASGSLVLAVPPQIIPPGDVATVVVQVVAKDETVLMSRTERPEAFRARRIMVLASGQERWRPGVYTLRLRLEPGPAALVREAEVRDFPFEVIAPQR